MSHTILIVDDDPVQLLAIEKYIGKLGYKPVTISSGNQAVEFFTEKKSIEGVSCYDIDVILLDITMPDLSGFEVLEKIKPHKGDLPVIMLTAQRDTSATVDAINAGATDYIIKGEKDTFTRIITSIGNAIEKRALKYQVASLQRSNDDQVAFSDIMGESAAIKYIIEIAKKTADSKIPILIQGESGTGKELLARAIHGSGKRTGKPFVAVNCGTIPENLAESILFGHEKGSFTGATNKSIGKFREASGGTLFLDEIGELSMDMQVKLLRATQEGEVEPVGGKSAVKVDTRIISATNRDLEQRVAEGKFREDLYYRLNVLSLTSPPLRERKEDVALLIDNFIHKFSIKEDKRIRGITKEAYNMLYKYSWPGNIRQLKNSVFRAIVLCGNEQLDIEDFPQIASITRGDKITKNLSIKLTNEKGVIKRLKEIEKDIIHQIIDFFKGDIKKAAQALSIDETQIIQHLHN